MQTRFSILCLVVLAFKLAGATEAARPNVLLILVDDLKPALGAYGDPVAISPNIDRLAARGMRFDLAYCNQAICAPSRNNLMLGTRSTTSGLYALGVPLRNAYPDGITLPQAFRQSGWKAESMGKVFHIGHGNTGDPASWSVPHTKDKVIDYVMLESTGGRLTREEAYFTNAKTGVPNKTLPRGAAWERAEVLDDAYADGRVASVAIDRLRSASRNPDQPFFMAVGFARPHLPFSAPEKYWALHDWGALPMPAFEDFPIGAPAYAIKRKGEITQYKPVPVKGDFSDTLKRTLIHGYYASVSYMDAQVGRVIDEMDRLGLAENTIIVLWGDHGFHLGDHGSWTKHSNHEQANRIPLILVAPGTTRPGSHTLQLAETVDLYPTLCELAGIAPPDSAQPIDGVSLVPVLKEPSARVRDHAYHAYPRGGNRLGQAIRTERYRLVKWKVFGAPEATAEFELYDYEEDPLETVNLADERPEAVSELLAILGRHPKPAPPARRKP